MINNASSRIDDTHYDIVIIGGGVNGSGIARDAAGRGFRVCLCESNDFGSGTSSSSTKLIHGGLRYLEYFKFRLVREALIEREILLRSMPHISWPMRFVLPYSKDMRFDVETPASRFLNAFMPWMKGRRPAWMIRFGLFIYDHLGGRKILPATSTLDLSKDVAGLPLKSDFTAAYEYSDGWVMDSRLVLLNLQDAVDRGAHIHSRTKVHNASYNNEKWILTFTNQNNNKKHFVTASMVINATGPWVDNVLKSVFHQSKVKNVRLVRGSHIVIAKKYGHDRCYFFQNTDSRIIFTIPYEGEYTLIGTTDIDHGNEMSAPVISRQEKEYLCQMASEYFIEPVTIKDIVWSYSGVRPLYDDGSGDAQEATRDYVVKPDEICGEGTLINIFGGKITTYRKLAESVMENVELELGARGARWTHEASLPGGDFDAANLPQMANEIAKTHPYLAHSNIDRLLRQYGTLTDKLLAGINSKKDLGNHFGHGFYEFEARYLHNHEWAVEADDYLFRRTKLGVRMTKSEQSYFANWILKNLGSGSV